VCNCRLPISPFIVIWSLVTPTNDLNPLSPIDAYWNLFAKAGTYKCINESIFLLISGCYNTVEDFIIVVLPMPLFWKLSLPRRQRLLICGIFGIGFCVVVSGIIRTYFTDLVLRRTSDTFWNSLTLWLTTVIELNVGLVSSLFPCRIYRPSQEKLTQSRQPPAHQH
jgi:hypothetical protein